MDLVISTPNLNAVMGKDSIEMDSAVAPATGGLRSSPSLGDTENLDHALAVSTSEGRICIQPGMTPIVSTSSPQQAAVEKSGGVTVSREAQVIPPQLAATGLQILTRRKRSSLSAAGSLSNSGNPTGTATNVTVPSTDTRLAAAPAPPGSEPEKTSQPPKKKKKYTPKPKKAAGDVGVKSKVEPKSKQSPKSKARKTLAEKKPASKSKKGQQQQPQQLVTTVKDVVPEPSLAENVTSVEINEVAEKPAPPMSIAPMPMPKLTKMPITNVASSSSTFPHINLPVNVRIKEEPQDWEDNLNDCDTFPVEKDLIDEPPAGGKPVAPAPPSRKKKSKGRNGNIYIGVFNRIEWMKLQGEFGFQTVNNFGTFVLETLRRVRGDIQFWCDVATTSGVYQDLSHYEWQNGFPHAVNHDGHHFTPEAVEIDEDKKAELGEMARVMWQERQEFLKQQQQQQEVPVEVVTVPDDVEEVEPVEEEEVDDPGAENYLGNMANRQYFPSGATLAGGEAHASAAVLSGVLTQEQLNMMWNKETSNPKNLQVFGELFNYVNGIQQSGRQEEMIEQEGMDESVESNLDLDASGLIHRPDVIIEEIQEGETDCYAAMQVYENTGEPGPEQALQ